MFDVMRELLVNKNDENGAIDNYILYVVAAISTINKVGIDVDNDIFSKTLEEKINLWNDKYLFDGSDIDLSWVSVMIPIAYSCNSLNDVIEKAKVVESVLTKVLGWGRFSFLYPSAYDYLRAYGISVFGARTKNKTILFNYSYDGLLEYERNIEKLKDNIMSSPDFVDVIQLIWRSAEAVVNNVSVEAAQTDILMDCKYDSYSDYICPLISEFGNAYYSVPKSNSIWEDFDSLPEEILKLLQIFESRVNL